MRYKKNKSEKLSGEGRIDLKVKFKGTAARFVKEYEYEKADSITPAGENEIVFEKKTTMTPEILKWVMSFGDQAEVIEPEELKVQVIENAKNILENYCAGLP